MNVNLKIMLKSSKGYCFKYLREIVYFKACDKYIEMVTTDGCETTIFHSLKEMEERLCCGSYLGSMIFFRTHRQFIAALHYAHWWRDNNEIILETDHKIPVGRVYRKLIIEKLSAAYS